MANIVSMTERLLLEAGVGPGMRVLDLGCGGGEVSFLLAKLVGAEGQVVGLDQNAQALALARERAREQNLANVTFIQGDVHDPLPDPGPFDAVAGRRVLMYLREPVEALRRISAFLQPGGLAVFQESDSTMFPGRLAPFPLHERVHDWMWRTVALEGADVHMGFKLASVLAKAGFSVEHVRAEAVVQGKDTQPALADIVRMMLARIVGQGVASEREIDIATLHERLDAELRGAESTYISDLAFGVWARKP
ncbi:MAG: methyltransferase domain-containing protein [Pseudomonadota bacterium]